MTDPTIALVEYLRKMGMDQDKDFFAMFCANLFKFNSPSESKGVGMGGKMPAIFTLFVMMPSLGSNKIFY